MKVLHVGKFFHPSHGGIETFLMDLARASHAQGVEQGLIVHAQQGQRSAEADLAGFPFLGHFDRVRSLGSLGYAPISPHFGRRLGRAIARFAPDLLYLHLPNPSAFWALASPAARRLPWVIHWHADASDRHFARIVRALYPFYFPFEQALLQRAARVVVSSPPYLDGSRALARWRDKCRIVPLGLDPGRLHGADTDRAEQTWGRDGRLRILALGRLTAYKGFDVLVRTVAKTRARVVIAGHGEERARLERLVAELELGDRIELAGGVSDAERNGLLATCDLLCLPSLNRAEAFGISVLEAMALGKPALVSKLEGSGLSWLVEDGTTGWQVPPGRIDALAERINHLDRRREALTAAGRQAGQRYRAHFDIETVAGQIVSIQREVTRPPRG